MMLKKILSMGLALAFCGLASAGCAKGDSENKRTPITLPDYENMQSEPLMINGWLSPPPTTDAYREYKEAGFNYIFIMGQNAGAVGSEKMENALEVCDELGIKAFVDISRSLSAIDATIENYSKHPSFAGYNYDEPVIYRNTINMSDGIVDIAEKVKVMHKQYPTVEFLVNLNPSECVDLNWGTPKFTYAEYLDAQTTYINSIYKDSSLHNWLSCDSYPICNNQTSKHPYYLKTSWLQNLAYLAEIKRDSEVKLTTNFFIQSMPYGTPNGMYDRKPTYEDIRLQAYSLLAYGYDSISYFCYATPNAGGEFQDYQQAMIDRDGNKTDIYESGKAVNEELRSFEKVYRQFNSNWLGVCPVYGTNNTSEDEFYFNKSMDALANPLELKHLSGLKGFESDEDVIIGYMKDGSGNPGFMVVNYNDSSWNKKVNAKMNFGDYTQAQVYRRGKKSVVDLKNGILMLELEVGEGAFVIPCS